LNRSSPVKIKPRRIIKRENSEMNIFNRERTWEESSREAEITKEREVVSSRWKSRLVASGIEFPLLFSFWILISGHYQLRYLLIGLGASALVTYLTKDLIYKPGYSKAFKSGVWYPFHCAWRLIFYIPWLMWAIVKSNIQIAMIILNPRLPIDPGFLQFKSKLTKKVSLVTLANSITLTPGTITVDLNHNIFLIHAIARGSASDLESGLMQNKAGAIFCDVNDPVPDCSWNYSCKELKK
jgi:multicomponent Na+:H+ antiporter subunit E